MFNKKLLSSIDLGKYAKKNPYKKDMILDPMGQWKHPGKNTRIPSSSITMKGVNYPVLGVSNTGQKQMMQPGQEYNFPGADYVDEYPQMKKGGSSEQKIIFSPMEGGCPDGQYWTGSECKPIPPGTKIVYSQEELDKLNISKKEQQKLYNDYLLRERNHATINAALRKKYGPQQSIPRFYKTFNSIPRSGFSPMMSIGSSSLIPNGLGSGIPSMKETMMVFKNYKKLLDQLTIKPIGYKGHPNSGHFYPVYEKPSNYILGYNREEKKLEEEPIELPIIDPPLLENKDLGELQVHDYTLPDSIEAPQYTLDPYTDDRLRLSVTPGKSRKVTKRGRLSGGQRYKHTEYKPTKDLEFGKKEVTKPIAALVQKLTGYDPKYFEGYEDEEGNFVPGELDYGNATGSEMEFRGAASLRDYMNQQKYKKEYEEYDKKLDTWFEQYEQSKKKQEQGQAFKKGGAKKKYTSDIINSTNYLFAEHPLFKKKKQSKKRIYDPKAKYYQFGGLTRLTNLAGKTLKLPPAILNESNILPIISNLKPASSISKDLKIGSGVKGLLADPRYRTGREDGFPVIEYDFPSASIRQLGDYKYQPYSEGWWAEHDMKSALEQPQWVPGKEDFFTDQEIVNLVKQQKDYDGLLAAFNKMNPESDYDRISRMMLGDFSRDELFSNLFPNASIPNFRSKFLTPKQNSILNNFGLQNITFQDKGKLNKSNLINDIAGTDTSAYNTGLNHFYNAYKDYHKPLSFSETKEFLIDHGFEKSLLDEINDPEFPPHMEQLDSWKMQILKDLEDKAIKKFKKNIFESNNNFSKESKLTGLDAYNKMLNQSGSRNKYGGQLSKAKYGHSIGNLIRKQKGGQLPRAQFGLTGMGKNRAVTATPFDFRTSYGQTSDFNRNPNYSLTYTTPKLFKKAELVGNPLSITLGRPYNTDAQSLTNRTLNLVPQEGLFTDYYDPALQGGSNPKYQQYLQDVSNTTGTPVSELNQTVLNQYNAAKNLAGAKPLYKKGIPLTANVGWDAYGTAFGSTSSGPFTGYGSVNAGYAPEPGLYGTLDIGAMGVFGKTKNNSLKPKTYFNRGLIKQGDRAFIPKLNILNIALRQRPEYNDTQTQNILNAYANDIEQGTRTAQGLINENDEKRFDMSFLSPEATFQIKPFKNFPGVASITGGLRLDYGGKDTSGDRIPITPKPYGNVRYTVPIEGAIDKLKDLNLPAVKRKKTYNDYANDQEYDEEYTDDTPEEDTSTENNIEVNPPELQVNPNGTVLDRGDCPEGYERPCPKCRCEKIKMPQMYTDKRGTHLFGNEPIRFKDGGEKEAMNAMMKARLAYANMFGNPSAQRMINIPDQPYEFDNGDMGTHYMASMDNYAVPQIQDENGQLMLGNYGPESREAIRFDSDEDANYFAENYKDVSPGFIDLELTEDQIEEYRKGGYVVEDISVPSLTRMQPGGLIKSLKPVIKGVTESVKNIDKVKQASKIGKDISAIGKEILGEVLQGSSNRKAIASGNSWLNNWISNPITQAKIQEDILGAPLNSDVSPNYFSAYSTPVYGDRAITDYDKYIYALDLAKDFKPGVTEYPISTQITDFIEGLSTGDAHSHLNNKGFSTMHTEDPFQRELYKSGYYKPNSTVIDRDYSPYRNYGSFVSRDRSISPYDRESISIHEGTHDWITDWLLRKTGQSNLIQSQLDPDYLDLYNKWKNKDKTLTKLEKNKGYYADPTEVHARIMQLRRHNDLTPFDMITDENSGYFMDQLLKNNVPFNGPLFAEMLGNDRNKLAKLMNDLYGIALPVGVATGAGALLANPYQDQSPIGEYKNGGQYGLGDEVDEATMKQLKKLGFTFEKIK